MISLLNVKQNFFMQFVALLIFIFLLPVGICSQPREIIFDGTGSLTRDIVKAKLAAENLQLNEEWSATIRGYAMIGDYAFTPPEISGVIQLLKNIVSVTIENGCETIGEGVFWECSLLVTVNIKSNLKAINSHVFCECVSLENITLPETVETIDNFAFENCKKISFTELPAQLKTLGMAAFSQCANISVSEIPEGVTSIGSTCFKACNNLPNKMKLNKNISNIGAQAFYNCANLTTIVCLAIVPPKLGQNAFSLGYAPKIVYVPEKSIDAYKNDYMGWGYIGYSGIKSLDDIKALVEIVVSSNNDDWGTVTHKGSNLVMESDTLELVATPNNTDCRRFLCWENIDTGEIISEYKYKKLIIDKEAKSAQITAIFE